MKTHKMKTDLFTSLSEAKDFVSQHSAEGCVCPTCESYVKIYKRNLNSVMSRCLIRLYNLYEQEDTFYHVKDIVKGISDTGTNDFSKLLFWELIRPKPKSEKDFNFEKTKTSGYWKISEKGILFVQRKIQLNSFCLIKITNC